MISLTNHDSRVRSQWGRDEIYPEISSKIISGISIPKGLLMGLLFQRESPHYYNSHQQKPKGIPMEIHTASSPRCQQHQTLRRLRRPGREVVRRDTGLGRGRFFEGGETWQVRHGTRWKWWKMIEIGGFNHGKWWTMEMFTDFNHEKCWNMLDLA